MEEKEKIKILLIEDDNSDAMLITSMLKGQDGASFEVEREDTLAKGLKRLEGGGFDIILLDLILPDSMGFPTFSKTVSKAPLTPIIVMTGLNDETMAIRAVGKGAQDYLVKGEVDGNSLKRAIRYAVARKSGEEKKITVEELKGFDGKEGRQAYIAYKGKVFEVSGSKLWETGVHGLKHFAGNDLTEDLRNAPHGEEMLARLPIIGNLVRQETLAYRLLVKIEQFHPHPISVHFSIAYSIAVSFLSHLYLLTGNISFERASYYMLVPGFFAAQFAGLSGLLSWKIAYEGKMTAVIRRKIVFTGMLVIAVTTTFVWRITNPEILIEETVWKYVYSAMLMSLTPIVLVLGHAGGKIIHP